MGLVGVAVNIKPSSPDSEECALDVASVAIKRHCAPRETSPVADVVVAVDGPKVVVVVVLRVEAAAEAGAVVVARWYAGSVARWATSQPSATGRTIAVLDQPTWPRRSTWR